MTDIDLSNYVRIGLYDLPEPTRTTAPAGNLLAQEASGVTYNWDTNTLFVVGDGGTSVTEVSLTGQFISTMTLAAGSSPQGTEFYDTEGITYIGNGEFVFTEERYRQVVKFTYQGGTTLTRANAQTVDLGTDIGNVGNEGLTYDPATGGFIVVKETGPQSIFQTNIDFAAGTATNGSSTTVASANLFDPAKAGLLDFSDVYALSSNAGFIGSNDAGNLLILSQESGKVIELDRAGNVLSSMTLQAPTTATGISIQAMTVEGITMGPDGTIYIVSEEGGGDFNHPQLWVYKPASTVNAAPTAIALVNETTAILENTSTASRVKVADIALTDDGIGTNVFTVTGADAAYFEADSSGLYIKAGVTIDYETKTSYSVTVNVDDASLGATPDASVAYTLAVTNIVNEGADGSVAITEIAPWSSGNSPIGSDWFELTNTSGSDVALTGWKMDDNSFASANAVPLSGVTTLAAGESAIFLEVGGSQNAATVIASFISTWFGGTKPAGLQIGTYTGAGVGLGTGGDGVAVFNASGTQMAKVSFGASPGSAPYATFDNSANAATVTTLSAVGVNGAFAINPAQGQEIGSPGTAGGVAAPVNHAPTAIGLSSELTQLAEGTSTAARVKVANVLVTDDGLGTNTLAVTGADAAFFEVDSTGLYLKAGTTLDFETKASYAVTVTVDDTTLGATPDASVGFTLTVTDVAEPVIRVTEVAPWSSGNSPVGSDWFEITNTGTASVDLTGWKMDDNSFTFASGAPLSGVTTLGAGESAIFLEVGGSQNAAAVVASFIATWFGGTKPAGLQIGTYTGAGVGLSTGGDGVAIYDAGGALQARVSFGASSASAPYRSFDNSAGADQVTLTTLSAANVNGANAAVADASEIGSPGTARLNTAPVLSGAQATLAHGIQGSAYTVTKAQLLTGVTDGEGDTLAISGLTASAGTVADNGDGSFTITPTAGFFGPMNLGFTIVDGHGGTLAATQSLVIDYLALDRTFTGKYGADVFTATADDNWTVNAIAGNDRITTAGGRDIIDGGAGNDIIVAGSGDDVIKMGLGSGADSVDGGAGNDIVTATADNVLIGLSAIAGVETITAGGFAGVKIVGTGAANVLDFTGATLVGITAIESGNGIDTITGSAGDDVIDGGAANDMLDGGQGNDTFLVGLGSGRDVIQGGAGTDTVLATADGVIFDPTFSGVETISSGGFSGVAIDGGAGNDVMDFTGVTLTGIVAIRGGVGIDTITGSLGNDVIDGGVGVDLLNGGDGDDIFLVGSTSGKDVIDGGTGSDTVLFTSDNVAFNPAAWSGIETIDASGHTGVRILGGITADVFDFTGVTLTNIASIQGSAGNDTIIGSAGADVIVGGAGADLLSGGGGSDSFQYNIATESRPGIATTDHILDFAIGDLIDLRSIDADATQAGVQSFTFVGSAAFTGLGQLRVGIDNGHVALFGNISGSASPELAIIFDNDYALTGADLLLV